MQARVLFTLWLPIYSVMHKNIVFNQSDHEPPCCSNTESQHARMTGSVKWGVMTPVQRGGLVAMTLKHGTPHLAPVKCFKKLFLLHLSLLDEWLSPTLHALPPAFSVASVHVTSLFSPYTLLWSKTHNTSSERQRHASYYGTMDLRIS